MNTVNFSFTLLCLVPPILCSERSVPLDPSSLCYPPKEGEPCRSSIVVIGSLCDKFLFMTTIVVIGYIGTKFHDNHTRQRELNSCFHLVRQQSWEGDSTLPDVCGTNEWKKVKVNMLEFQVYVGN